MPNDSVTKIETTEIKQTEKVEASACCCGGKSSCWFSFFFSEDKRSTSTSITPRVAEETMRSFDEQKGSPAAVTPK